MTLRTTYLPSRWMESSNWTLAGEDVAEIDTPAIVNKPIEPRLFVLEGNGYGYEFLRPSDVEEYFRKNTN